MKSDLHFRRFQEDNYVISCHINLVNRTKKLPMIDFYCKKVLQEDY